jgi:acyl-CoA reductase-like NAD-dependent aldehyde dehydrogenase
MGVAEVSTNVSSALEEVRSHNWRMLVGGELRPATGGESYTTESPSLEERLAEVPAASASDVDTAVRAADASAADWGARPVQERAAIVRRMAEVLVEHEDELAVLDALDGGNAVAAMRNDIRLTAEQMGMYADWALELKGETIPATADHLHYSVREPYGVVARIVPYNHPALFTAARSAAPLIAGNAVIVKCADQTPLSSLRIAELFADLIPPGVFSVLSGYGTIAGDALARHPLVRRIAFTGSVATGLAVQRAAAETCVKHVTLELGGKNPMIVFPDADLDSAVNGAVRGMNFHWTGGQSCGSTSRLLLHESMVREFVPRLLEQIETIRVGDPLVEATEMGSMVSRVQYDKVMTYIQSAKEDGAELLIGGGRPDGSTFERGHFVAPTVFAAVTPQMRIAREEIFGPVLSILTYRDHDEAIAIANGVDYGLTASIWTRDLMTAHRTARQLKAGYIWVNDSSRHFGGTSFGGFKNSGVGREEGVHEVLDFTQLKTINVSLAG